MNCPDMIGNAKVICYASLGDMRTESVSGLAICQQSGDDAFYLFGCDAAWRSITDTWHQSLSEAKKQAEFEHAGISGAWKTKP